MVTKQWYGEEYKEVGSVLAKIHMVTKRTNIYMLIL